MTFIGTAGWSIPSSNKAAFPGQGSHLERYATRFSCVEINSSFYRPHKRATYEKWAATVPSEFRFSVKIPRSITQIRRLHDYGGELDRFIEEVTGLGTKLGVLLVQLPPSLAFERSVATKFFRDLAQAGIWMACEARHASWFDSGADKVLKSLKVARVSADPPRAPTDGVPGGDTTIAYFRLHGSPKTYYSNYSAKKLSKWATKLRPHDWCIFDNTAGQHALANALSLKKTLR
ncbi:MAG TPA: DUF72 domain-containing protein [Rhizomicrobium sp.]|jgi:uncharacterized protein YecE (DUF72 family)|nr:DUF72 domain-containing protein [Rhizomicrobium sp.]